MSHMVAPLELLLERSDAPSVGIGDGGNELGCGAALDRILGRLGTRSLTPTTLATPNHHNPHKHHNHYNHHNHHNPHKHNKHHKHDNHHNPSIYPASDVPNAHKVACVVPTDRLLVCR